MEFSIKQAARMTGLTEHTLRFYTDRNLVPCRRKLEEVRRSVEYLERKTAHYEEILAGKAADDTNPAFQTIEKC